ncbi:hypothetical protein [Weissella paramesenteroides]|uniref:hypothetical protein n=1 Tax=Weissella paramesenteroides TaxID=1249 RepID=UPI00223AE830|nr:hypothetical protein [Weissella paramesenteroides]MCT0485915.1 hypothetical protein [Weissella paramesenteroides]
MHNMLIDKKIKTVLGTYKVSIRSGEKMLVLLSGAASFDTEQTFRPIINLLPENIGVFAIDYGAYASFMEWFLEPFPVK